MADKSNAMKHAHELWHRVFFEVAREYPEIDARHVYVDALCQALLLDPTEFQVIVTCNLFGDIVTDLGAALQGGPGMAASANVHPRVEHCCDAKHAATRVGMFEPVHGSAPPLAGKDVANPFAAILSAGMLLGHLGWPEEQDKLERLVARAVAEKKCTRDIGGDLGTRAVGDWIVAELAHALASVPSP
jgi:3-isopropylmalate dehydrogenase